MTIKVLKPKVDTFDYRAYLNTYSNPHRKMAAFHTGGSRCCATESADGDGTPSLPAGGSRSVEELKAKCADFLAGRYGNLTTEEIEEFREAQADPDGTKWEREHAGEVFGMDAIDLNGFLFVEFPTEMPLERCMEILRKMFRRHTITPDRLWWVTNNGLLVEAIAKEEARHDGE